MAHHFDVVPVGANDERRVVVRVVVRTQARRAVVCAARLQRRAMEGINLLAPLGHKCQVKVRRFLIGLEQAQRCLALRAEFNAIRRHPFRRHRHAQWFECLEKERFARGIIADAEFDVVKHGLSGCVWGCVRTHVM